MKKILLLISTLFFIGCGEKNNKEVIKNNEETNILIVGTNAEYKPFEYLDSNGELTGFDIELMKYLTKKLGYTIEWKNMSFDGLIPALNTGQVDAVIAGMSASDERKKAVDFSISYNNGLQAILVNKSSEDMTTLEDFKGKTIGVQIGSIQANIAGDVTDKVKLYSSFTGAVLDLNSEKIDGVVVGGIVADEYVKNNPKLKILETIKDNGPGAAIAFPKGNSELVEAFNKEIQDFLGSDKHKELSDKYLNIKI